MRNVVHLEGHANELWPLRSVRLADRRGRLPGVTFWRVRLCAAAEKRQVFRQDSAALPAHGILLLIVQARIGTMNLEQGELSAGTAPQPNRGKTCNIEYPTSNIQRRTSNRGAVRCRVGSRMLDVSPLLGGVRGGFISVRPHQHRSKKKSGACCSGTNPACCNEWILARNR